MTATKTTNDTIRAYVRLADELAETAARLKELQSQEAQQRPAIVEMIDGRAEVRCDNRTRILERATKQSIKRLCSDEAAAEAALTAGVKVSERSPLFVAPATFSKAIREGKLPQEMADITEETLIIVT